jgi:hypothetical protein
LRKVLLLIESLRNEQLPGQQGITGATLQQYPRVRTARYFQMIRSRG